MDYIIKEMKDLTLADNRIWGNKAAYLSDAKGKGIRVPEGFCIAVKGRSIKKMSPQFMPDVDRHFNGLQEKTHSPFYIVRSSSQYEDRENHIFPGIYISKKDISNIEELLENVERCYESFGAEIVSKYIEEVKIREPKQEYYCVMIQEQIEPEYSGVAFTKVPIAGYYGMDSFFVEMVEGHCHDMLQGEKKSNAYIVRRHTDFPVFRCLSNSDQIDEETVQGILGRLAAEVGRIMELYGPALNIEWGYKAGEIIIFQIRPMVCVNREPQKKAIRVPAEEKVFLDGGLKVEAMKKFYKAGLFPKKLILIEPGKTADEIMDILGNDTSLAGEITIRYSCKRELGLPRCFAKNKKDALYFIRTTYEPEWAVILYESISVRNSYELYLDEKKAILEHVPGMWETDSKVTADLWIYQEPWVEAFAAGCLRKACYENALSKEYQLVEPYTEKEVREIAAEIRPYIERVRKEWPVGESGNFHFVRDTEGRLFFLNYRKISKICKWKRTHEELTIISSKEDFMKWKSGDILLKLNLQRGEEVLLKEYIPFLKRTKAKVYVQFGILSHPSILLREMGIEVYPEYTLHRKYVFELS